MARAREDARKARGEEGVVLDYEDAHDGVSLTEAYRIPVRDPAPNAAKRRRATALCGFLGALCVAARVCASGIEGRWTTFDDDTGKPRSTVDVVAEGTHFKGRIVALVLAPDEPPQPRCTACTGDRADAPIIGMTILDVTRREGTAVEYAGTVFDPEEGRDYRCVATLSADGSTLTLRGYIGIPLLGREATWRRAP